MCGGSCWHWMAFAGACWCLLVPDGVFLVSYGVWRWEEGVWGFTQSVYECCLWTWLRFGSLWGSIWVFRPCMMQQMLYIGKSPKGEIPHTWHFWNIKIPKPPYVSSLKIIGLLHLFKFLGPSKENYNLQSLWITLYYFEMLGAISLGANQFSVVHQCIQAGQVSFWHRFQPQFNSEKVVKHKNLSHFTLEKKVIQSNSFCEIDLRRIWARRRLIVFVGVRSDW